MASDSFKWLLMNVHSYNCSFLNTFFFQPELGSVSLVISHHQLHSFNSVLVRCVRKASFADLLCPLTLSVKHV